MINLIILLKINLIRKLINKEFYINEDRAKLKESHF